MKKKIIIYQRFLAKFRYGLLEELSNSDSISEVKVVASKGMAIGSQKGYIPDKKISKLKVDVVKCLSKVIQGKRTVFIPFYPTAYFKILKYDIVVLEGTSNLINNIFLVPIARILGKKIIWWDAGFNGDSRTTKRKITDFIVRRLINFTNYQMAYSNLAKDYIEHNLKGKNCFCNLNTICTTFFEQKYNVYKQKINARITSLDDSLNLIYVGSIEKRKELHSLIKKLIRVDKKIKFTIIGDGNFKDELMQTIPPSNVEIIFKPSSYDFAELEDDYLKSHIFMMPGEGGLSIIQSMQFGTPVIAIKADGTELDYISQGRDGFICITLDEFINTLNSFLKLSPQELSCLYSNTIEKAQIIGSKKWCDTFIQKVIY